MISCCCFTASSDPSIFISCFMAKFSAGIEPALSCSCTELRFQHPLAYHCTDCFLLHFQASFTFDKLVFAVEPFKICLSFIKPNRTEFPSKLLSRVGGKKFLGGCTSLDSEVHNCSHLKVKKEKP